MHNNSPSELAGRRFDAQAAFSEALAAFQLKLPAEGMNPAAAAQAASAHGFSWLCRPVDDQLVEVCLRHSAGACELAIGGSVTRLLAGLLGLPLMADDLELIGAAPVPAAKPAKPTSAPEPEPEPAKPEPAAPAAIDVAAAALAAATGGAVAPVDEPATDGPAATDPLSDTERQTAVAMLKALTAAHRKAFAISFRDAFRVAKEEKSIAPLITERRHLDFIDRFTVEAAGGVSG
jgi:hypothetical protein